MRSKRRSTRMIMEDEEIMPVRRTEEQRTRIIVICTRSNGKTRRLEEQDHRNIRNTRRTRSQGTED